jgi:predicted transcriptional regulator of viral defense system
MVSSMNLRLAPNQIARKQHALITHEQALAAGLSPSQIRHRHRSGEWSVVRRHVYAVTGAPPTWLQSVAAVALTAQPGAWISHRTAGRIWGLAGVDDERIHVVTDLGRRIRLEGVCGHRSGALFTADITTHHRIPVTTPARALVDVSNVLGFRELGNAVDDALRRRILTVGALRQCVARLAAAPGRRLGVLHELLAEPGPRLRPGGQ